MFAYIPARGGSKRIPLKNVRPLGGSPVIVHVIRTLRQLDWISSVYVSTDDEFIRKIAEEAGAICLSSRSPELSDDSAGFADLIHNDIPRFASHAGESEVLFVLATAALVPPDIYDYAYQKFQTTKPDILMSCERSHPFWTMTEKSDGFWWPLFPEKVLTNSQDLPRALIDAGLFYFFNLCVMQRFSSVKLADRIEAYEVPSLYTVDVDTPEDWSLLEYKFQKLKEIRR